jgi:hypothetical protein
VTGSEIRTKMKKTERVLSLCCVSTQVFGKYLIGRITVRIDVFVEVGSRGMFFQIPHTRKETVFSRSEIPEGLVGDS